MTLHTYLSYHVSSHWGYSSQALMSDGNLLFVYVFSVAVAHQHPEIKYLGTWMGLAMLRLIILILWLVGRYVSMLYWIHMVFFLIGATLLAQHVWIPKVGCFLPFFGVWRGGGASSRHTIPSKYDQWISRHAIQNMTSQWMHLYYVPPRLAREQLVETTLTSINQLGNNTQINARC